MNRMVTNQIGQSSNETGLERRVMLASSSDFEDGTLGPFNSPNTSLTYDFIDGQFVPYFSNAEYEGSRYDQGFEIFAPDDEFNHSAEMSFDFTVPSADDPDTPFPEDKNTIVHQFYNWSGTSESPNNWAAHLKIIENDLYATYRSYSGGPQTSTLLIEDIPRDEQMNIEQYYKVGNGTGEWDIWIDGEQVLDVSGADIGWGPWSDDGEYLSEGVNGMKTGMYANDTSEYTDGDERHLFYDNISIEGTNY